MKIESVSKTRNNLASRGGGFISDSPNKVKRFGYRQFDERDEELERLRKLVRNLEFEVKGRRQRGDRDDQEGGLASRGDCYETGSNQSGSHRHRHCSHSWESRQRRDRSRS